MNSKAVDIYLYADDLDRAKAYAWSEVNSAPGSYNVQIDPRWWNATSNTERLHFTVVEANTPVFAATMSAGPVWTAQVSAAQLQEVSSKPIDVNSTSFVQRVSNFVKGLAPGSIAAAVLVPILVIGGLVAFWFIRRARTRGKEDRQRWSVALDKRMSTISKDWSSITPAGASAAIRQSMAFSGVVGGVGVGAAIRPSSTFEPRPSEDGNRAGVGALSAHTEEPEAPPMAQLRPGLRQSAFAAERQSRVVSTADLRQSRVISFADEARPSTDSRRRPSTDSRARRSVGSRHFPDSFAVPVPPLPARTHSGSVSSSTSNGTPARAMSPTQTAGAFTLTAEDIRARLSVQAGAHQAARPSMDEMMPALSSTRSSLC
jgi:hypothetical protein